MIPPLASTVLSHAGPVPITEAVVATWAIMVVLVLGGALASRTLKLAPSKTQAAFELIVDTVDGQIRDTIQLPPAPYRAFIGTLFVFIFVANWSSLVPGVKPPTAQIETDAALALVVFAAIVWFGIRAGGVGGYLKTFATPSLFMVPLNFIETITRTFSMLVRLFGNVMSGVFVVGIVRLGLPRDRRRGDQYTTDRAVQMGLGVAGAARKGRLAATPCRHRPDRHAVGRSRGPGAAGPGRRASLGWRGVLDAHKAAWSARWRCSEAIVEGDPAAKRALRFAAYHLNGAANPDDECVSIAARGLTGTDYHGHVFWDTEIFLLPFYSLTWPKADIDLADSHVAIDGGIHIAALGGVWLMAVFGFAGVSVHDDCLAIDPILPLGWTGMSFPIQWQGSHLEIRIEASPSRVFVTLQAGEPVQLCVFRQPHRLLAGKPLRCTPNVSS